MANKKTSKRSASDQSTDARYITPEKYRNGQVNGQYIPIKPVQGIRQ
jgi:hypothetical protein